MSAGSMSWGGQMSGLDKLRTFHSWPKFKHFLTALPPYTTNFRFYLYDLIKNILHNITVSIWFQSCFYKTIVKYKLFMLL